MAGKKEIAQKPRNKVVVVNPNDASQGHDAGSEAEEGTVMVTVTVPKHFKLTVAHGEVFLYQAGVQEMPLDHAEHWFSVANGVKIYDPEAAAKKRKAELAAEALAASREEASITWMADAELRATWKDDFESFFADRESK